MAVFRRDGARTSAQGRRHFGAPAARGGAGEPLLFLHGAGGWPGRLPLFEKLAVHYDVLVPEHPGFGSLDNAGSIPDVADMAMYYLDFLQRLATARVPLVCNSL